MQPGKGFMAVPGHNDLASKPITLNEENLGELNVNVVIIHQQQGRQWMALVIAGSSYRRR